MVDFYLTMLAFAGLLLFAVILAIDFFRTKGGANPFFNKWTKKTLWIWLPFYALQRLVKEVILKKK